MPPLETIGNQGASKAVGVCMCEWGHERFQCHLALGPYCWAQQYHYTWEFQRLG